ncbi:MAG: DUF192 domain-containing protein [Thermoanaerobaculia bacterium]
MSDLSSGCHSRTVRVIPAKAGIALVVFSVSLACSPARGRESKAPETGPSVVLPSGARYAVEIAATPEFRAQGLMFRESLAADRGMLFLFPSPTVEDFWMKNCNFPIDIVWMGPDRRVIYVSAHTPPCKEDPCPKYGPRKEALYVLEIPDGAAAKEKIVPGAILKFENVPGPPKT